MTITLPDENGDVYLVDGLPVPRWHTLLRRARLAPELPDRPSAIRNMINAKHRGKQVHDAAALVAEGHVLDLDFGKLSPESAPYVSAFLEFWGDHGWRFNGLRVETPLYCQDLNFCCTPDFHDSHSVNDLKTADRPSRLWGLQLAAQALAHGHALERRVIWLRPKRKTASYELMTPDDLRVFSPYDFDAVREICLGEYDGPAIRAWKADR